MLGCFAIASSRARASAGSSSSPSAAAAGVHASRAPHTLQCTRVYSCLYHLQDPSIIRSAALHAYAQIQAAHDFIPYTLCTLAGLTPAPTATVAPPRPSQGSASLHMVVMRMRSESDFLNLLHAFMAIFVGVNVLQIVFAPYHRWQIFNHAQVNEIIPSKYVLPDLVECFPRQTKSCSTYLEATCKSKCEKVTSCRGFQIHRPDRGLLGIAKSELADVCFFYGGSGLSYDFLLQHKEHTWHFWTLYILDREPLLERVGQRVARFAWELQPLIATVLFWLIAIFIFAFLPLFASR